MGWWERLCWIPGDTQGWDMWLLLLPWCPHLLGDRWWLRFGAPQAWNLGQGGVPAWLRLSAADRAGVGGSAVTAEGGSGVSRCPHAFHPHIPSCPWSSP